MACRASLPPRCLGRRSFRNYSLAFLGAMEGFEEVGKFPEMILEEGVLRGLLALMKVRLTRRSASPGVFLVTPKKARK